MRRRFLILLAATLLACSCGHGDRPALYAVRGKVLYRGKAAEGARVVLHPVGAAADAPRPFAVTGPDGAFAVTTYEAGDGAPEGEYAVTVLWQTPAPPGRPDLEDGPDRFKGRYADPKKSQWRLKVEKKPVEMAPIALD